MLNSQIWANFNTSEFFFFGWGQTEGQEDTSGENALCGTANANR